MAAYSIDLRQKSLHACERRLGSQRALSDLFGVSLSVVEKLLRRHRTTGDIAPKPHAGGQKPCLDAAADALVRRLVHENTDITLAELCARVADERGMHVSERGVPRVQQARQEYRQRLTALDLRRLTFVDESGVNLAMTRLYGRTPAGERVVGSVPQNYGQSVTMLGALSVQGLHAVITVDGATGADAFRTYVKQVLGPTLTRGDIVVMDNLQAHKAVGVQQAIARRGARLLYLPPYSPDLSPIEPCWSKVKTALRKVKARTRAVLDAAIAEAMVTVSHTDVCGWFKHCGYPLQ